MFRKRNLFLGGTILLAVIAFAFPQYTAHAQSGCTKVVAKDGSGDFTSIQAGIDAISSGQSVCVKNGVYIEVIDLPENKPNITVKNFPGHTPVIDGQNNLPETNCAQKDRTCVLNCYATGQTGSGCTPCSGSIGANQSAPGRDPNTKLCKPGLGTKGTASCTNKALVAINGDNDTFEGFEVKNSSGRGVIASGRTEKNGNQTVVAHRISGVTVRNVNSHHHYGLGFQIWIGKNSVVDGVKAWISEMDYMINCHIGGNGFNFSNVQNTSINNVDVYYNGGEGLALDDVDGIRLTNSRSHDNFHVNVHLHAARNLYVDSNVVYCSENAPYPFQQRNIGIMMADEICAARDIYGHDREITNNVIIGCDSGLSLRHQRAERDCDRDGTYESLEGLSRLENDKILNNTVIGTRPKAGIAEGNENSESCQAYSFSGRSAANSVFANNVAFSNSTCTQSLSGSLAGASELVKSANSFLVQTQAAQSYANPANVTLANFPPGQFGGNSGTTMIISDPYQITANHLVPNVNVSNFTLKNTSALINAGNNAHRADKDMFGVTRPVGATVDIGAQEYVGVAPSVPPSTFPSPQTSSSPSPSDVPDSWDLNSDGKINGFDFVKLVSMIGNVYTVTDVKNFLSDIFN